MDYQTKEDYIAVMVQNEHAIALFPDLQLREKIFNDLWEHNQKFSPEQKQVAQEKLKQLHLKYDI